MSSTEACQRCAGFCCGDILSSWLLSRSCSAITTQDVDAIVTVANESLLGGGGADGAIHGGRLAEAGTAIGPCEPGDAMVTPAFDLDSPVRHVIHTVGPVWEGGGYGEATSWPRATGIAWG